MAKTDATIVEDGEKRTLRIGEGDSAIRIPLSEEDPTRVKAAFNRLLMGLREDDMKIEFVGSDDDLFSQVAREYVRQLNAEILEVRREMKRHGLTSDQEPT